MPRRIGEALIERGLIDARQLERALDAQLIFGGHLGTNLIELGFVDETSLVETLGDLLNLNHATVDMLQEIPPSVIHSIPAELVTKYQVVPVRLEGKTLHVAVIDPKRVGPLSSRTGYKIVPHVAPEIRVFEALEKYYGVPRRARYITICNELDRKLSRIAGPRGAPSTASAAPAEHEAGLGSPEGDEDPIDWDFQYGRSWREIAGEPGPPPPPTALDRVARRLCRAESPDDLSKAVLDHAGQHMDRAILFSIRSNTARIWAERGLDLDPDRLAGLRFPLLSGSIFTLLLGTEYYLGPVPEDDPGARCFHGSLGLGRPEEILLAPVYLNDRLVSVFYGEGGERASVAECADDCLEVLEKLALALSMLVLKKKILAR